MAMLPDAYSLGGRRSSGACQARDALILVPAEGSGRPMKRFILRYAVVVIAACIGGAVILLSRLMF